MVSRRAAVGVGILVLLLGTGVVEYHGSASGLVLIGLFFLGGAVGYRTGAISKGALYGALLGVGLTLGAIVLAAIVLTVLILVTIPLHGGWGLMSFGIVASMLATPLGPLLAAMVFGGAALIGGLGGLLGGALARGGDVSTALR